MQNFDQKLHSFIGITIGNHMKFLFLVFEQAAIICMKVEINMVMKDTIVFVTGINFLLETDYNMH